MARSDATHLFVGDPLAELRELVEERDPSHRHERRVFERRHGRRTYRSSSTTRNVFVDARARDGRPRGKIPRTHFNTNGFVRAATEMPTATCRRRA
jgi:hypothetical protein